MASVSNNSKKNQIYDDILEEPLVCFVSKIDVKNNFIEVCDTKYSVKCAFSNQAQSVLKDYVKKQPEDINILGLLGKQLLLEDATLRFKVSPTMDNQLKVKLRVQIKTFQVLASNFDAKAFFPKVQAIEEECIVKSLIQAKVLQS